MTLSAVVSKGATETAQGIVASMKRAGIDLVATLPDTWIGDLINSVDEDPDITLVRVSREEDGVGVCAGAFLGGRMAALVAQNGGMLQAVNSLAALAMFHQIPILMLLVQRGDYDDGQYYQIYKGRATIPVLEALKLPYHYVDGPEDYHIVEAAAKQSQLARLPVAVLFSRRAMIGDSKPKG
jgi:sulfopyruvate decarboxylase subunit alpha